MADWWEDPLRDGEYDVPVMFRVTGSSAEAARERVKAITDTATVIGTTRHQHIVPMWTPPACTCIPYHLVGCAQYAESWRRRAEAGAQPDE